MTAQAASVAEPDVIVRPEGTAGIIRLNRPKAINAVTLKPTQSALWLRPPVPPERRNAFYRGFNAVYGRVEHHYAGLISRMASHAGLMTIVAFVIMGMAFFGLYAYCFAVLGL